MKVLAEQDEIEKKATFVRGPLFTVLVIPAQKSANLILTDRACPFREPARARRGPSFRQRGVNLSCDRRKGSLANNTAAAGKMTVCTGLSPGRWHRSRERTRADYTVACTARCAGGTAAMLAVAPPTGRAGLRGFCIRALAGRQRPGRVGPDFFRGPHVAWPAWARRGGQLMLRLILAVTEDKSSVLPVCGRLARDGYSL